MEGASNWLKRSSCFGTIDTWLIWNLAGKLHITDVSTFQTVVQYSHPGMGQGPA
jgi:glycerol kinase